MPIAIEDVKRKHMKRSLRRSRFSLKRALFHHWPFGAVCLHSVLVFFIAAHTELLVGALPADLIIGEKLENNVTWFFVFLAVTPWLLMIVVEKFDLYPTYYVKARRLDGWMMVTFATGLLLLGGWLAGRSYQSETREGMIFTIMFMGSAWCIGLGVSIFYEGSNQVARMRAISAFDQKGLALFAEIAIDPESAITFWRSCAGSSIAMCQRGPLSKGEAIGLGKIWNVRIAPALIGSREYEFAIADHTYGIAIKPLYETLQESDSMEAREAALWALCRVLIQCGSSSICGNATFAYLSKRFQGYVGPEDFFSEEFGQYVGLADTKDEKVWKYGKEVAAVKKELAAYEHRVRQDIERIRGRSDL